MSLVASLDRLKKPPAAHNFARHQRQRTDDLAKTLERFALNPPRHSLQAVVSMASAIIVDQLSDATVEEMVDGVSERVQPFAREIMRVFPAWAREQAFSGSRVFDGYSQLYRVNQFVNVPVRPHLVLNTGDRLIVFFFIFWARDALDSYQKRVLTTLVQETIMSDEDFYGAEIVFVSVPRHSFSKCERYVRAWSHTAYGRLTSLEMQAMAQRYSTASQLAEINIRKHFTG